MAEQLVSNDNLALKQNMDITESLSQIVNLQAYPILDNVFQAEQRALFESEGALVLPDFLTPQALDQIKEESARNKHLAYFTNDEHNIYLTPPLPDQPDDHPHNRLVLSSKGCLAADQVPVDSPLFELYSAPAFRDFLCHVLDEEALHEYADPLSSINLNYADDGQELGWHYDNSSFAITLMIQAPDQGGEFQYVKDVRDADAGEMNFSESAAVLDGRTPHKTLPMSDGTLVLFAGRNSMHRVTKVVGDKTRILVVLAYNSEPGISLSELARQTFFGRLS